MGWHGGAACGNRRFYGLGAPAARHGGMLVAISALASRIARSRGVPCQVLRLQRGTGIKFDLARDPGGPEQRDRGLLLLARDSRHVHARAEAGNRRRAGAVDALTRAMDRRGRNDIRRIIPHTRHRLRSQSRARYAVVPSRTGFSLFGLLLGGTKPKPAEACSTQSKTQPPRNSKSLPPETKNQIAY